jgi:superfamily II DNA/RNA helicase
MRGQGYEQVGGKLSQPSTLGKSGTDVKSPIALIVVPTRELGVQTALLLFELVGGNKKKVGSTDSSGKKNMLQATFSVADARQTSPNIIVSMRPSLDDFVGDEGITT